MAQAAIYTIGHSNRKLAEFLELLTQFDIAVLVDVRRYPTSKWEWYKRENLEGALALEGVRYVHLGDSLGGYRKGGYVEHTKTEEFALGIERLLEFSRRKRVPIMCAEKLAFRCHRRYIAYHLQRRGVRVMHIVDKHRTFEVPELST